jgi:hypothetical protein
METGEHLPHTYFPASLTIFEIITHKGDNVSEMLLYA